MIDDNYFSILNVQDDAHLFIEPFRNFVKGCRCDKFALESDFFSVNDFQKLQRKAN